MSPVRITILVAVLILDPRIFIAFQPCLHLSIKTLLQSILENTAENGSF